MAVSKTDIANLALNHVGEPTIMDINDKNNATARVVKSIFDQTFREVARDHEWNCLKKRVEAAQLTAAPVFGFSYQYQLPSDFIRLLRLNGRDIRQATNVYEIEGLNLLTDATSAKIQYIADIKDTTIYDTMLVEALAVYMGSKLATQIRQDEGKAEVLLNRYMQVVLPRARKVDGNERNMTPYDPREQSRSLQSRRVGTFQGSLDNDAF
jgi:hypothetical protein